MAGHVKKSLPDCQAFWEKTRRLQHGTLVLLWSEGSSQVSEGPNSAVDVKIVPCVVSDREVDQLAPRNQNRRPALGLRYQQQLLQRCHLPELLHGLLFCEQLSTAPTQAVLCMQVM